MNEKMDEKPTSDAEVGNITTEPEQMQDKKMDSETSTTTKTKESKKDATILIREQIPLKPAVQWLTTPKPIYSANNLTVAIDKGRSQEDETRNTCMTYKNKLTSIKI